MVIMNGSEQEFEWSGVPDQYEIEISESQRFSEVNFNDTNSNQTLTIQGKFKIIFYLFYLVADFFFKQEVKLL